MSELYENAVCLAPMVRSGTLPLRLLSLRYGADLVYGEEIIDKRIIATDRIKNEVLHTVDYVSKNGASVVFRTCDEEKSKVVFQIGTADAVLALKAAEHVSQDVVSVDINMGCPKHFSIQGGMGVALLQKPDIACDIIKTLRRNLNIPVSCKIRLLEDTQATIDVAKRFEQAGAFAIGVHARHIHERPVDNAHWEALAPVVSSLSVPVLANGDIFTREDLDKVRQISGANSFLLARGALTNASIFRKQGMLSYRDVVLDYLKVAAETDNVFQNTKYNLSRMIPTKCDVLNPSTVDKIVTVAELGATKDNLQMFTLWDLQAHYQQYQEQFQAKAAQLQTTYGMSSYNEPAHTYSDEHVLNQQFYCNTCKLQLLSDKDVEIHRQGKRHKKKLRSLGSVTTARVITEKIDEPSPVPTGSQQRKEDEDAVNRSPKRVKRADGEDNDDIESTQPV